MKKGLIAAAAVVLIGAGAGVAAFAHGGHPGGKYSGYHHDVRGDGWRGRGGRGPRIERMFERMDADGDGAITREELAAARSERFAAMDADGDGAVTAQELANYRMLRRAERRIRRLDENGDGVLQLDELPGGERRFERFDLDGNGVVTRAEAELVRDLRGARRGGRWDRPRRGERLRDRERMERELEAPEAEASPEN